MAPAPGSGEDHASCISEYLVTVRRYDFNMDYKDISERIALLTQEIRDLQQMNTDQRIRRSL